MLYYICLISAEPGYAIPASSLDELLRAHLEPMATKFHSAYILTQAPNSEMTDVCVVCVCVRARGWSAVICLVTYLRIG